MESLDALYWRILQSGLISIRDAAGEGDLARCRAEAEHIHNIPSLISEENVNRHIYYAMQEREAYIEWVLSTGRKDLCERALLVFAGEWEAMDSVLGLSGNPYDERLSIGTNRGDPSGRDSASGRGLDADE
jgi:hypothetical protein